MSTINSLPSNEDIERMRGRDIAELVLRISDAGASLGGAAALDVNRFLAHAALKLARHSLTLEYLGNTVFNMPNPELTELVHRYCGQPPDKLEDSINFASGTAR